MNHKAKQEILKLPDGELLKKNRCPLCGRKLARMRNMRLRVCTHDRFTIGDEELSRVKGE